MTGKQTSAMPKKYGSLVLLPTNFFGPDQAPGLHDPYSFPLGNRLDFQYNPETIKRQVGITWNGAVVPGHSHKRWQWGGAGDNSWKFSLEFFLDSDDKNWVKNRMLWLESCTRPTYDSAGTIVSGPPHLQFSFGEQISSEVILMPFEYETGLVDPDTLLPRYAKADLYVHEIQLTGVSGDSLRR